MKSVLRSIISIALVVVLGLCAWTAYANVFSDDTAVRARADQVAREAAGCGKDCAFSGIEGSRGMITETLTYYVRGGAPIVVTCRRAYISFGEYRCEAPKR